MKNILLNKTCHNSQWWLGCIGDIYWWNIWLIAEHNCKWFFLTMPLVPGEIMIFPILWLICLAPDSPHWDLQFTLNACSFKIYIDYGFSLLHWIIYPQCTHSWPHVSWSLGSSNTSSPCIQRSTHRSSLWHKTHNSKAIDKPVLPYGTRDLFIENLMFWVKLF